MQQQKHPSQTDELQRFPGKAGWSSSFAKGPVPPGTSVSMSATISSTLWRAVNHTSSGLTPPSGGTENNNVKSCRAHGATRFKNRLRLTLLVPLCTVRSLALDSTAGTPVPLGNTEYHRAGSRQKATFGLPRWFGNRSSPGRGQRPLRRTPEASQLCASIEFGKQIVVSLPDSRALNSKTDLQSTCRKT